jgi:hypothetical protein
MAPSAPHRQSGFPAIALTAWAAPSRLAIAQRRDRHLCPARSAVGSVQWTADGVALCTAVNGQSFPAIATDGAGGAIAVRSRPRRLGHRRLRAPRVLRRRAAMDADGVALRTATGFSRTPGS